MDTKRHTNHQGTPAQKSLPAKVWTWRKGRISCCANQGNAHNLHLIIAVLLGSRPEMRVMEGKVGLGSEVQIPHGWDRTSSPPPWDTMASCAVLPGTLNTGERRKQLLECAGYLKPWNDCQGRISLVFKSFSNNHNLRGHRQNKILNNWKRSKICISSDINNANVSNNKWAGRRRGNWSLVRSCLLPKHS